MKTTDNISIDNTISEQLKDPAFAEAWAETELEDQIKRNLIQARIDAGQLRHSLLKDLESDSQISAELKAEPQYLHYRR